MERKRGESLYSGEKTERTILYLDDIRREREKER